VLAVVLAAGRGSRLGPLTTDRSKAMMPVAGKPMIERVLDMLAAGGVDRGIVVAHPEDRELLTYLDRSSWVNKIRLSYQEQRLGMVQALECAVPQMGEEGASGFLLASCDNLYPKGHVAKLLARYRHNELDAAVTLMWTSHGRATASAVAVLQDHLLTDIIEKPDIETISSYYGSEEALSVPSLYVLSPKVLDYLRQVTPSARGEREFPDALRLLIADGGRVGGQEVGSRMTLTTPQDLLVLNRHVLRRDPTRATVEAKLPAEVTLVPPVRVEAGVHVACGCRIGPETYLESGCQIGAHAIVRRSVIMRRGQVEPDSVVEASVISHTGHGPAGL